MTPVLGRKRAKESARYYLPYATQITADIAFNWRSFMHFQGLRNDEHAQDEIHEIAQTMLDLIRETGVFNASLDAFGYHGTKKEPHIIEAPSVLSYDKF